MATLEESIDIGCPVNMTQDDLQMRIQILTATPPPGRGGEAIWDTSGSSTPPRTGEPQMKYRQIASSERYAIAALRRQGLSLSAIARDLERAPSTIAREVRRNGCNDLGYRAFKADSRTRARRSRSRRNERFTSDDWTIVERQLRLDWSPEQVSGFLRVEGLMYISHETIYLHAWRDKRAAATCGVTCARRARSAASATAPTTVAEGSQASATSRSARRKSHPVPRSVTGRSTR